MPELDLPAPSLVIGRDHYAGRSKSWSSVRSAQLSVGTGAATLLTLLQGEENAYVDSDITPPAPFMPNGTRQIFTGKLVLLPYTKIKASSVTFTVVVSAGDVDITDNGSGVLAGTNVTGTIDYVTGAWAFTFSTGAPDAASVVEVDYTEFYVFGENDIMGLWLYPAGDIRATFDGVTAPTSGSGIGITEAIFLTGQPGLIGKMKLIAAAATNIDVEILV